MLLCPVEEAGCRIAADGLLDVCLAGGAWDRQGRFMATVYPAEKELISTYTFTKTKRLSV